MSTILKYLGVFVVLIGVAILAVPSLTGSPSNTLLVVGIVVIVLGYLSHIFLNKKTE